MKLPGNLGDLDFGQWAYGLLAAFIGGGASAFAAGVANILNHPGENIWSKEFWMTVSTTFMIAGLIAMFAFMRNKPLPDMKQVERMKQMTTPATANTPEIVETLKETSLEPKDAKIEVIAEPIVKP